MSDWLGDVNKAEWLAEVKVSGVPVVTDAEREAITSSFQGFGEIRTDEGSDEVCIIWRLRAEGLYIRDAAYVALGGWRRFIDQIASAVDPVCTDFRITRAVSDDEAEAELKKVFGETP